jgi:hypothetical protein
MALHHRPFNPESIGHQKFIAQTHTRIKELKEKYPFIQFSNL